MTVADKEILACRMIQNNADVTIGEYWDLIKGTDEQPVFISSETPVVLPVQFRQVFRIVRLPVREPLKDPSPYKRPQAKYDNRGHSKIVEEYS